MDRYQTIRQIAKVALRLRDAELQKKLAALQAEAVHRAAEYVRRWRKVPESMGAVGRRGALSFRHDVFWLKKGAVEEGPLCPGCWGREEKAVLMQVGAESWGCPVCHREVRMPDFFESRRPPGQRRRENP
jgi:tRNA(Ile2) C34 agmatinyltransferase TiaS